MPKAKFNNQVIAESDKCEMIDGNHYFPPDSIRAEYFKSIGKTTRCMLSARL